jgi:hypothetical protein
MRGVLLFLLLLCFAASSEARMYHWVNPRTGTIQLSGAPPSWYRAGQEAPRVLVFDQGKLVDDTAVPVSARRRQELRDAAFQALTDRKRLKALQRLEQVAEEEDKAEPTSSLQRSDSANAGPLSRSTITQLKAIIASWDQRRAASAGQGSAALDAERLKAIITESGKREAGQSTP